MSITSILSSKTRNEADAAISAVENHAANAKAQASEAGEAALKEINALVTSLKDKMSRYGIDAEQLSDKARNVAGDVETTLMREIKDRPLRTLAIAGAAGLFLGLITRK